MSRDMVIKSNALTPWWSSRYGLHDTKGAPNEITPGRTAWALKHCPRWYREVCC